MPHGQVVRCENNTFPRSKTTMHTHILLNNSDNTVFRKWFIFASDFMSLGCDVKLCVLFSIEFYVIFSGPPSPSFPDLSCLHCRTLAVWTHVTNWRSISGRWTDAIWRTLLATWIWCPSSQRHRSNGIEWTRNFCANYW